MTEPSIYVKLAYRIFIAIINCCVIIGKIIIIIISFWEPRILWLLVLGCLILVDICLNLHFFKNEVSIGV